MKSPFESIVFTGAFGGFDFASLERKCHVRKVLRTKLFLEETRSEPRAAATGDCGDEFVLPRAGVLSGTKVNPMFSLFKRVRSPDGHETSEPV